MYQRADGMWVEKLSTTGGKMKYFYSKTKAGLRKKILEYLEQKDLGPRFFAAAVAWDRYHASQTTYNANQVYKAPLQRAKDHFGDDYLKNITADVIQAWIRKLADQGFARRTVQMHLDMMRMIFDHAITNPESGILYNPCSAVRIPSGLPQNRRLPPTDEQLEAVTPDTESAMGLFAFFLMYTGLRRGELLALEWKDIDRKNKVIRVSKSVYYEGNQPKIKTPKTAAGIREVDLLDVLADALPAKGKGYVFGGEKPLTKIQFRKQWIQFCKEVGLVTKEETSHVGANNHVYTSTTYKPTVTPHQFRHAFASMLDDAGIDETAAKTILGHSSIVVTKDIYTHLRAQKRQRVGGALNDYVNNQKSGKSSENAGF